MSLEKIPEPDRELMLLHRHGPTFFVGEESLYDIPGEISFDPFKPSAQPVIYVMARMDEEYYYFWYMLYHWMDWAKGMEQIWDEHRHDFEGILVRFPYYPKHNKAVGTTDLITVFHHELKAAYDIMRPSVRVEARGHGILPEARGLTLPYMVFTTKQARLIFYDRLPATYLEAVQLEFNNNDVNLPHQWAHHKKFKGWFLDRPGLLFDALRLPEQPEKESDNA
jgi:hypothetical protein